MEWAQQHGFGFFDHLTILYSVVQRPRCLVPQPHCWHKKYFQESRPTTVLLISSDSCTDCTVPESLIWLSSSSLSVHIGLLWCLKTRSRFSNTNAEIWIWTSDVWECPDCVLNHVCSFWMTETTQWAWFSLANVERAKETQQVNSRSTVGAELMHKKQILKFVYDAQRHLLIGPTGQWSEGQNRNTIAQEHGLSETKYIQKHVSWFRKKWQKRVLSECPNDKWQKIPDNDKWGSPPKAATLVTMDQIH